MLKRFLRPPDFIIGGDNPYLLRWWIIPRNRWFNIYLHKFLRDDDDRALHDHPWVSMSIILRGGYLEHLPGNKVLPRYPGNIVLRRAKAAHRVQLYRDGFCLAEKARPAWTIFITGPRIRQWGFHCPKGWVHWEIFCGVDENGRNNGLISKGCDD